MEDRFIADFILKYAKESSSPNPQQADEILELAKSHPKGYMCLGPLAGYLLRAFILVRKPKSILEVGTFTGYTLSVFDACTPDDCKIISIDDNSHGTFEGCLERFSEQIRAGKIELVKMEGMAFLRETLLTFDMIFLDARKETFYDQLDLIHSKLNEGGLLICDNALAGLKVFNPGKHWEHCAVEFNQRLKNDDRFSAMLLPLRDGFNIAIKVK